MNELLQQLSDADAIAGREKEVRTLLRNEMKDYSDEIRYDHLGSICFKSSGTEENPVKIMFSAHMDEVGFFVRHISDNGFIYLIAVGGVLDKSKEMQKVRVTTESGKKIPGILNVTKVDGKVKDMYVDVGCETGQEILDLGVQIGDMVTFASESYEMAQPKVICGKAMDDRTGCYVISNAIKKIHEIKHKSEVWMVASSSEEVGTRGGKTTTELIDADIVVAVDVANNPELVKNFTNHRLLSKGCMILHYDKTMVPNEKFLRYVKKLAKEHDVLFQEDMFSGGGTDCANAHLVNSGKLALVIGIPLRYCHAAWSLVHEDDLNNAISLVTEIATSIGKKEYESFINFEED